MIHRPVFLNTHFAVYWRSIVQHQFDLAPVWVLAWWRVWKGRNHVDFNQAQFRFEALYEQFASHLSELPLFCQPPPQPPRSPALLFPRHPLWTPPMWNHLKVNVDGAVCSPHGGATGWVLRSLDGTILHAISKEM
ncbi:hypothetical protein LINPERHAP1_LOCUS10755 [Linum perenne]